MRDLLLTAIIAGVLPLALWRPAIGVYSWAWVSLMSPQTLTFGFMRGVPIALLVAVATIIGFVFTRGKRPLPFVGGTILLIALMTWVTLTSLFALNEPALVWERWWFAMKIFIMLLLTLMLLRGRRQIDTLLWVIVVSVGYYGVKGGIWTLLTGGGGRVWGPPGGMISDNNALAAALILVMPWAYYLFRTASRRWMKWILLLSMLLVIFAILGSQSRGALLALLAMAFFLGIKGANPVRTSAVLLIVVAMAIAFMPDSWSERMDTIQEFRMDSSAMSRLYTWQTLWNAALDRPLVGAGFRADNSLVFALYSSSGIRDALGDSTYVAHSIYFQALGEHGFVGLVIYLGLGVWVWREANRLVLETLTSCEFGVWVPLLMRMCQVSLVGFAVAGAFLSIMLLDLPYYIVAVVVLTRCAVNASVRASEFQNGASAALSPTAPRATSAKEGPDHYAEFRR